MHSNRTIGAKCCIEQGAATTDEVFKKGDFRCQWTPNSAGKYRKMRTV